MWVDYLEIRKKNVHKLLFVSQKLQKIKFVWLTILAFVRSINLTEPDQQLQTVVFQTQQQHNTTQQHTLITPQNFHEAVLPKYLTKLQLVQ